ncbi:hypothetical protein G6N82_10265 [Altererythrobacter sp. BO-6]|uniref:hypothetical protein n=1 Tax=Altererythrobacter sp. BO-6 TaxID=2604537 RepID=UPI0013E18C47|nr:hypothetical protein [Altererythrobacter sp. BO-6]QIG54482.1 hypothetical protein G6N82_10265 [Altererythrobacter sp. BO-6]
MTRTLPIMLAALGALTPLPLAAQAVSDAEREAIRQEIFLEGIRDCKPASMTRCWYLFYGVGDAPGRKLWLLDLKDQSDGKNKNIVYTDVLVIDESTSTPAMGAQGTNDFILYAYEVDCKKRKMRMRPESFGLDFKGEAGYAEKHGEWSDWKGVPFMQTVIKASCDKDIRLRPLAQDMAWVGDYVRPIDAVDFVRRFLWQQ